MLASINCLRCLIKYNHEDDFLLRKIALFLQRYGKSFPKADHYWHFKETVVKFMGNVKKIQENILKK